MKKEQRDKKLAHLHEKRSNQVNTLMQSQKLLGEAVDGGKKIIYVSVCSNCQDHKWCTQHKPEKYQYFLSL